MCNLDHETLTGVDEFVRLQSRPLAECFPTQLTHEVFDPWKHEGIT